MKFVGKSCVLGPGCGFRLAFRPPRLHSGGHLCLPGAPSLFFERFLVILGAVLVPFGRPFVAQESRFSGPVFDIVFGEVFGALLAHIGAKMVPPGLQ